MALDHECDECGATSPDIDESILHELVTSIARGKRDDALALLGLMLSEHPNAASLSERIAIAKAAA